MKSHIKDIFNFPRKKENFVAMKEVLTIHLRQLNEKKESTPQDVFDVVRFSIEEFTSCFESMHTLMKKKDHEGCIKISRSILETSVNLQYIFNEDTENRAKKFKLKSVKNLSDKMKSLDKDEYTSRVKEIDDYFQGLLKEYSPEKKIRDKFKEVNMDKTYVRSYKRLSEFVHPVYKTEKVNFNSKRPYIMELKRTVEADTCLVTLSALKNVCTKYDLDGAVSIIDDPGYAGPIIFATNPKKAEQWFNN